MSEETVLKSEISGDANNNSWLGLGLISAGVLLLLSSLTRFHIIGYLWPWFIVGLGLLMVMPAHRSTPERRNTFSFMAIPGMITVALGVLLFLMSVTNHFESMAYAWTLLIAAGAVGKAYWTRHERPELIEHGTHQIIRKMVLAFMILGSIFELIIFHSLGPWWPLLVIGLGIYVLNKERRSNDQ